MGYSEKNVKEIHVIGSSVGYQYNDASDVDVSIMTDIPVATIKEIWRMLPNGNTIPDTKHPVNYYLTADLSDVESADNAYDLRTDKWDKKPTKEKADIPMSYILDIAKFFMAGIQDRLSEYERDKKELEIYKSYSPEKQEVSKEELDRLIAQKESEVKADLDSLFIAHHIAKAFRKEAFEKDDTSWLTSIEIKVKKPNFSVNNLVYKTLEEFGYLEKLEAIYKEREKLTKKE